MGYVPPPPPFRPNLDRLGMPRDYATYLWATYGAGRLMDPERRRLLYPPQVSPVGGYALPAADTLLMGYEYR